MKKLMLVLLIAFCSKAQADQYEGYSAFAALSPKYNIPFSLNLGTSSQPNPISLSMCDALMFMDDHAGYPIMPVLYGTFDGGQPDLTCVGRFVERYGHKPHAIEIHLTNEAGRRKGKPSPGDLFPNLNKNQFNQALISLNPTVVMGIAQRVIDIRTLFEPLVTSHTTLILSNGLESQYSRPAAKNLMIILRNSWPHMISGNPLTGYSSGSVDFLEVHGNRKCPFSQCIANEDGTENSTSRSRTFLQRNKHAFARILWDWESQGKFGNKKPAHLDRDFRISKERLLWAARLLLEN